MIYTVKSDQREQCINPWADSEQQNGDLMKWQTSCIVIMVMPITSSATGFTSRKFVQDGSPDVVGNSICITIWTFVTTYAGSIRKMTRFWVPLSEVIRPPLWAREEKPTSPVRKFWILASSRRSDPVTFLTFSRTSLQTWPEEGCIQQREAAWWGAPVQFWDECWGHMSQDVVLLHNSSLPCTASHTVAAVQ